ncbi:MAG: aldo/keto reductase [Slackia sp.]|nr:aldo/keto reductase [Slackia sp.]
MENTLLDTAKLGFGCMRLPLLDENNPASIDIEHFKRMVDAFIEGGGTYFDTAFVYHDGASESALHEALVKRYPRDAYTIATKCLAWAAPDAQTAQSNLETSLSRLGVDYVDFYLLHNVGGPRTAKFDEYGMWDFAQEMKAQGKIKNVGFSMHDGADTLDVLLTAHPDMDFVQLQVNYLDWNDPVVQSRRCLEVAQRHGVPVVIMEPARGGRLIELPERAARVFEEAAPDTSIASWAYRFCYGLPNVIAVLSGMSSIDQVRENIADWQRFGTAPFSDQEQHAFDKAIEALRAVHTIPCTNCRYCVKDCPQGVAIPNILALMNLEAYTENREFVKGQYSWQAKAPASACIACGACEDMCPQKIDIINQLAEAAERYE